MSFHFSFNLDPDRNWYSYLSSFYQGLGLKITPSSEACPLTGVRDVSAQELGRAAVSAQKTLLKGVGLSNTGQVRFQRKCSCRHWVGACSLKEGPRLVVKAPAGLGTGREET